MKSQLISIESRFPVGERAIFVIRNCRSISIAYAPFAMLRAMPDRSAPLALLVALVAAPAAAWAQPISFQLKNDVAAGQKPALAVTAMERVLELKIDLARDDGEKLA